MPRLVSYALLAALISAAGCKKQPDDKAVVQGEWRVTSVEAPEQTKNGNGPDFEGFQDVTLSVQGDRVTVTHAKERGGISATFKLNPNHNPKQVDIDNLTVTEEGKKDIEMPGGFHGIYKLEGDELTLALPLGKGDELPRPTDFKTSLTEKKDSRVLIFHLKKK